jgi:dihydropyrimidine dehydrogenase (NAD+) subunit PreA
MWEGFGIIDELRDGLKRFMRYHNFRSVKDFIGIGNRKIKSSSKNLSRNQQLIFNIDKEKCIGCGKCYVTCRDGGYEAISFSQDRIVEIVKDKCVGCGLCKIVCPVQDAIYFTNKDSKERTINES